MSVLGWFAGDGIFWHFHKDEYVLKDSPRASRMSTFETERYYHFSVPGCIGAVSKDTNKVILLGPCKLETYETLKKKR